MALFEATYSQIIIQNPAVSKGNRCVSGDEKSWAWCGKKSFQHHDREHESGQITCGPTDRAAASRQLNSFPAGAEDRWMDTHCWQQPVTSKSVLKCANGLPQTCPSSSAQKCWQSKNKRLQLFPESHLKTWFTTKNYLKPKQKLFAITFQRMPLIHTKHCHVLSEITAEPLKLSKQATYILYFFLWWRPFCNCSHGAAQGKIKHCWSEIGESTLDC